MSTEAIRAWYVSSQRLPELISRSCTPEIRKALLDPVSSHNKAVLANLLGSHLLTYLREAQVLPLHRLIAENKLKVGTSFVYQGHLYGKGFGYSNKSPAVSLSINIDGVIPPRRLKIEFSKSGLTTDTAYTRLTGSTNLFAFCSIFEISNEHIRATPYVIGDLIERTQASLDLRLMDQLHVHPQQIDQFANVDFSTKVSPERFNQLRNVPEREVKELLCKLLGEVGVPKDWGGEETDIFSSNLSIDGKRYSAAFLLKGPARFHEMTLADCGKNGDQIYRLFNTPADLFVVQHCHKITPAVRRTVEAYALSSYSRHSRFTLIDGYDTARILLANGII